MVNMTNLLGEAASLIEDAKGWMDEDLEGDRRWLERAASVLRRVAEPSPSMNNSLAGELEVLCRQADKDADTATAEARQADDPMEAALAEERAKVHGIYHGVLTLLLENVRRTSR